MDSHIKFIFGKLLECPELDFTGDSENPIHKALGIKIIVTQLAHVVCTKEQQDFACHGRFSDIMFSAKQERDFVQLQILLNLHLNSLRLPRLPLLHLSPRMLLPHKAASGSDILTEKTVESAAAEVTAEAKRKNRRKKKKTSPPVSVGTATTIESVAESIDADDDLPALEPCCIDEATLTDSDEPSAFQLPMASKFLLSQGLSYPQGLPSDTDAAAAQRNALTHAALLRADAQIQQAAQRPYKYSIPKGVYHTAENALGYSAMENVDRICDAYEQALMNQREQHGSIQQSLSLRLFIAQSELDTLKEKMGLAALTL